MDYRICVLLWPHHQREEALIAFEDNALELVADHGGRVVERMRVLAAAPHPLEVHVIDFPTRAAYDRFVCDPRRTALRNERDAAIARTEVFAVHSVAPSDAAASRTNTLALRYS